MVIALNLEKGEEKLFRRLTYGEVCQLKKGDRIWVSTRDVDHQMVWPGYLTLQCIEFRRTETHDTIAAIYTSHASIWSGSNPDEQTLIYKPLDEEALIADVGQNPHMQAVYKNHIWQPLQRPRKKKGRPRKS